jgi:hypothetical protein
MDVAVIAAVIGAIATVIAAMLGAWFTKRLPEKRAEDKENTHTNGTGEVRLQSFSINTAKCNYKEHVFDPSKPFWPEEDSGAVVFSKGEIVEKHGRQFSSNEELRDYEVMLEGTRNHRSFSRDSVHKILFERISVGDDEESNYPNFYLSVSNSTGEHVILNAVEAVVRDVKPLMSAGQSHSLPSLTTYQLRVPPHSGNTRTPLIPNLRIVANDAAAFDFFLIPETSRIGGHLWLIKLKFYYSENGSIETDYFNIIM